MTLGSNLIISGGGGPGHPTSGDELHHYYRQDLAPTASDPLEIGDLWSDTTANLLKRCTSLSPITFVSVEGGAISFGVPTGDVDIGDSAAEGASTDATRADHQHAYPAPSASYPVQVDIGDAQADGSATTPARSDHGHAFPAPGAGYPQDIDGTEADGSATTPARSDHVHAMTATMDAAHDIEAWISAAAMKGTATAGAGDADALPETRELATNDVNIDYMAFDTGSDEHAFFQWAIPTGWNEGTITFLVYWTAASGSGTVALDLKALAFGNSDALDDSWGTAIQVVDTLLTADDVHISPESTALTIGGTPAEGDIVMFDLMRNVSDDTLGVDAQVLGIKLTYTRNAYGD